MSFSTALHFTFWESLSLGLIRLSGAYFPFPSKMLGISYVPLSSAFSLLPQITFTYLFGGGWYMCHREPVESGWQPEGTSSFLPLCGWSSGCRVGWHFYPLSHFPGPLSVFLSWLFGRFVVRCVRFSIVMRSWITDFVILKSLLGIMADAFNSSAGGSGAEAGQPGLLVSSRIPRAT